MLTVFIRSVLLVCLAVCALRLMGKRQVGQLQPFELVIAIMIADLAATPMESLDTPLWRGMKRKWPRPRILPAHCWKSWALKPASRFCRRCA